MKPIKLEMTAFGSFKNHTVIDFSNFEKEVFLITGDTGAGKNDYIRCHYIWTFWNLKWFRQQVEDPGDDAHEAAL